MPSVFISYAHEDGEFVLALVGHLQHEGLDVRFDQVVLRIGDSLIRTISREIAEGDFLIAVVSPDSVESEWCQTELALARTQGIDERRIKVLPIRFRGAEMPPMLQDTYWGDADRYDIETLARQLGAAITAHLEGADDPAVVAAADRAPVTNNPPPHADNPQAPGVNGIDALAERLFDVLTQWDACREGEPTARLIDRQRRLRYALDALPSEVRDGVPLVAQISDASWNEYFRVVQAAEVEPDLREELRVARTQVAQGLPVARRWLLDCGYGQVGAGGRDAVAYLWQVRRGEEARRITVFVSRSAMASGDAGLPGEVAEAKQTDGRSVVLTLLSLDDLPRQVLVTTAGIHWPLD